MISYRKRLERDLERWREMDILAPDAVQAIRDDLNARKAGVSPASVLAILGAALLCFAAMTFVAANWQEIPKLTRLLMLFGGLWGSYAGAWVFQNRAMPAFAEAAILTGVGLFGASIMLIAQMYHIEGNPPDAVLTWAGGGLLAGVLLRSRAALALTVALISLWSWWEVSQNDGQVHWLFVAGWLAVAVPILWLRWRNGYHLLAVALSAWVIGLGYQLDIGALGGLELSHLIVVAAGLAVLGAGILLRTVDGSYADPLAVFGLAVAYAGLFALQIIEDTPLWGIATLAVLSLIVILGALFLALRQDIRGLARLAYLLFSVELLALYFKTLGTLLDTALFFLIAGLLVMGLAALAWRLSRMALFAREGTS